MLCRVRFLPSERSVEVPRGTLLLEAARRAGLPIARSCGSEAHCGRCGLLLLGASEVAPESERECQTKRRNRVDPALRLSCCLAVEGELTVTAPYW